MTNFIFCLIFIQVAIFFISGILLATSLYLHYRQRALASARVSARGRIRKYRGFLHFSDNRF